MTAETKSKTSTNGKLPKGWRMVRFEELVENINDRVDPAETDLEVYVGLEHLDPDSLKIRRWGTPDDVIGQKLRFQAGDIIFGKRRAYQRKLAVAQCAGICSAHAMVLRAKTDAVEPCFLPFFMQSDMFMERAVDISVGSLSPTINWMTLRIQKFPLPPKDEQRRIASILDHLDETVLTWVQGIDNSQKLFEAMLRDIFNNVHHKFETRQLSDVAQVGRGKFSHRPRNLPEFYGGPFPFVQTGDVQRADRVLSKHEYTLTDLGITHSKSFPKGTVLITIAAVIGATAIADREVYVTDSVVGVIPSKEMNVDFVELFLRSKRHYLENAVATQTAQKNINLQVLKPLEIPCPTRAEQDEIVHEILAVWESTERISDHLQSIAILKHALLKEVLGGANVH